MQAAHPGHGMAGQPPAASSAVRRAGQVLVMVANLLVGAGVIVLAFTLSRVTVSDPQPIGNSTSPGASFSVESSAFLVGTLLIGIGIVLRAVGGFLVSSSG